MQTIRLSDGSLTRVDDTDYETLASHSWHQSGGYARRTAYRDGEPVTTYMHREIANPCSDQVVDHINGDKLDNRRENLRSVSTSVNELNKPATRRSTTGLRGVYRRRGRYYAAVDNRYLGTFDTADEAYAAVCDDLLMRADGNPIPCVTEIAMAT